MGTKTSIAVLIAAVLLVLVVGGAYAYDSSQKDKIAEGVTIGGVDVGGLDEEQAKAKVHRKLVAPLKTSLGVSFEGKTWKLTGEQLKIRADLDTAVEEAVEDSQEGGLPGRLVRYVSGGEVEESIRPEVAYSERAVNRFVRHVAEEINREPENADVEASGDSLEVVAGQDGRKLRDNLLEKDLKAAVLNANAPHTVKAEVHSIAPEVTKQEVAAEYPSYLTLDRSTFTLRLWKHLKLAKTYTVAVGMEGLETPEGLYAIQEKEENPVWHVPLSDWAGSLAGQTIPPGPSNPIKARWMGIYEGAGIHGTEETYSLGSAASHGCVRMAIPDVEELYDEVEVGTPIFIG
ncbi:MAG TPA: L,D-transpeptidase/peptidoglycan binding protein [Solirubrobacterales bacterium]|nr:L,D-transpeptidase/peptidoglycan binding protein [Solirubrobacterales bacterium]